MRMRGAALPQIALLVVGGAVAEAQAQPTIDGIGSSGEWKDAQHHRLADGSELMLLRSEHDLYIGVRGAATGFPTICIGDDTRVDVLHASAALGTIRYTRNADRWQRGEPFAWHVRDRPGRADGELAREQREFLADEHWLANANARGEGLREFRIRLEPHRKHFAVVFLSTDAMTSSVWPASVVDGCIDPKLLSGDAPDELGFVPEHWKHVD